FFIEAPPPGLAAPFSVRQQMRESPPVTAHTPKLFQLEGFFGHKKTVRRLPAFRRRKRLSAFPGVEAENLTPLHRARRTLSGAATNA
ncbi:MAG: hypothetical protein LC670_11200, partial [Flavobacteriales bacterium]|nr:hypothetical protein [Flavobacteriales bacterium]